MWKLWLSLLIALGVVAPYVVEAPTGITAEVNIPTTYEVTITNNTAGEKRFSVVFVPQESGAHVEKPEGYKCSWTDRGTIYLFCMLSLDAESRGSVPFPVTWTLTGERQIRVVVFVGEPDGPVSAPIFNEYGTVTVVESAE